MTVTGEAVLFGSFLVTQLVYYAGFMGAGRTRRGTPQSQIPSSLFSSSSAPVPPTGLVADRFGEVRTPPEERHREDARWLELKWNLAGSSSGSASETSRVKCLLPKPLPVKSARDRRGDTHSAKKASGESEEEAAPWRRWRARGAIPPAAGGWIEEASLSTGKPVLAQCRVLKKLASGCPPAAAAARPHPLRCSCVQASACPHSPPNLLLQGSEPTSHAVARLAGASRSWNGETGSRWKSGRSSRGIGGRMGGSNFETKWRGEEARRVASRPRHDGRGAARPTSTPCC
eukprot:424425-Rhodomonas_salina.1